MNLIFYENKPIFTEIILTLIRQYTNFHMAKGIINAFDHTELCFVVSLTLVVTGLMAINVCY